MANPRRSSSVSADSGGPQLPVHVQLHRNALSSSSLLHFLKKPHAFPFLLSVFLLLTWISLRLQTSSSSSSSSPLFMDRFSREDDLKANLVRFSAEGVSRIVRDKRGWMVNPVTVAVDSGITGGAVNCVSTHVGEIRPGVMRGNHRHHDCNETFVIWGARMKFRLENQEMGENGYVEVVIGGDEVAVAASPSGTAHALVNIDRVKSAYFIGCQDSILDYKNSTTDFNVWKDL
ncbi:hypothetical protein MLD38_020100 [Melastoma candidum]|uniref:Uncharacterized protein n=1 Tax=Melastoma candidum TaxID=119954 RepID=A0ACB9QC99_9MYRT|nr:hypothetical protein MLD38_020100 [Melastoma candidum]